MSNYALCDIYTTHKKIRTLFYNIFSIESISTQQVTFIPQLTLLPLPLKLLKSEIWDIRDCFSLIIMYTFKIKDYNDNKNN